MLTVHKLIGNVESVFHTSKKQSFERYRLGKVTQCFNSKDQHQNKNRVASEKDK